MAVDAFYSRDVTLGFGEILVDLVNFGKSAW
jgi:hypothetical protein